ncbi:unnamed protein product [Phaeothamnion confervicola]
MKIGIAQVLAATKVGDKLPMEQVLLNLAERFGASGGGDGGGGGASATGGSSDGGSATKKQKKALEVVCDENRSMAEAFKELANYAFKSGDKFKGVTYQRLARCTLCFLLSTHRPRDRASHSGGDDGGGMAGADDEGTTGRLRQGCRQGELREDHRVHQHGCAHQARGVPGQRLSNGPKRSASEMPEMVCGVVCPPVKALLPGCVRPCRRRLRQRRHCNRRWR